MKIKLCNLMLFIFFSSCVGFYDKEDSFVRENMSQGKYRNIINIDSSYIYIGDSLYIQLINNYNKVNRTKSLSPEDEAFFSKKMVVKTTESILFQGRNYIYPGALLEGNSISSQEYVPVFINNRNPITISSTLTHIPPKSTSKTIQNPSLSKISDYVKDMVVNGSFRNNEKFMFQYRRFTFYDEIKQAFGTNINTRRLFSSNKENSTELRDRVSKLSGMYVKFFQSCFTINMDINPISDKPILGSSGFEPVYVNSLTYGRVGILVFETDETYEFAESCIKKEFDRIFYDKNVTLTTEEKLFFENTDFKILILGGDSDYTVQSVKGYSYFLNMIYMSKFNEQNYGVPIACTFSYANSHAIVETEFENNILIEPLFVDFTRERVYNASSSDGSWLENSSDRYLRFYKDRYKKTPAIPNIELNFELENVREECVEHISNGDTCESSVQMILKRNIMYDSQIFIGRERYRYENDGPLPDNPGDIDWEERYYHNLYFLKSSPFFIIL